MRNSIRALLATSGVLLAGAVAAATPDFTGVWETYPDLFADPNERFIKDPPPPGGEPQLKEPYASARNALLAQRKTAEENGKAPVNDSLRCLPEGMPTVMEAAFYIEFLQTPKQVVILAEYLTQNRRIYLNEKMPPLEEISPTYQGYSIGHWEGNTLVVETRGVREDVKFEPYAIPHSKNLKITERLRLTKPGFMEDRITLEDPDVLIKPYQFTFELKKNPNVRVQEYVCDNNHYRIDEQNNSVNFDVNPN